MDNRVQKQESVAKNLKQKLALAVRSIQWSYGIFWSPSATQSGMLEWGDGYYNGDIKTRKTVQSTELIVDELGLQRSEQLRELYESLSASEASLQAKRPSAALSPEDLTDAEWYYLVCMSFAFDIGQGLPGRTLATGQPSWLCNAHSADSKVFFRSLLAKSASIQTVVCFPYLGGVVELGVTELVLEDPSLSHHIRTSFYPKEAMNLRSRGKEVTFTAFDHMIGDSKLVSGIGCEEQDIDSTSDSPDNQPADSNFVEGINGGSSRVQSWQLMDDDFNNYVLHSKNSSDSQAIVDPINIVPLRIDDKITEERSQDVQGGNRCNSTALGLQRDDLHYHSVLSSLLKTSHPLILGPNSQDCPNESSFVNWKKVGLVQAKKSNKECPQQVVLKKILFEVPRMHVNSLLELPEEENSKGGVQRLETGEISTDHAISERKRREKLNEKFKILKSILPSINKVDKVSVLDDTIQYLQDLERRVEELETCTVSVEFDARTKRKHQDTAERTSDNYESNRVGKGNRPLKNKRKACDDESPQEIDYDLSRDSSANVISVHTNDKEIQVEIKCQWREGILLEIMDSVSHVLIDPHSVQSSTVDGILNLTIKSKNKGLNAASARVIKRALQRVTGKC